MQQCQEGLNIPLSHYNIHAFDTNEWCLENYLLCGKFEPKNPFKNKETTSMHALWLSDVITNCKCFQVSAWSSTTIASFTAVAATRSSLEEAGFSREDTSTGTKLGKVNWDHSKITY